MSSVLLCQRPPDQRMISMSMLRAPQRRWRRRPRPASIILSALNIASGAKWLSINKALFAYCRNEGPIGDDVNVGAIASTRPTRRKSAAASCTNIFGVRFPDSGRFDPSASA